MTEWGHRLALAVALGAATTVGCDGGPGGGCTHDCYVTCDAWEVVACGTSCPAGTSETRPATCEPAPCQKTCWSACDRGMSVACDEACPTGTTEMPADCDAGPPVGFDSGFFGPFFDAGRPFFDAGFDAGPPPADADLPGACARFTDEQVTTVAYDGPTVPEGHYFEDAVDGERREWGEGCASSRGAVRASAVALYGEENVLDEGTTFDRFFEVTAMDDATLVRYREHRCLYWDGTRMGLDAPLATIDPLVDLGSYLWFVAHDGAAAHATLGVEGEMDGPPTVAFCTVEVVADAGECDQLSVSWQEIAADVDLRAVTLSEPTFVRSVMGRCP